MWSMVPETLAVVPVALPAMATLFAGPEASLEIGDGPAAPDAAYCTMRLRVGGYGIQCDIDSYWFRDDLLALAALLRTLRDDPDALEDSEVDGQRGPGLRVLRAHPEDPSLIELWATASTDDPAVGVTFWLYYDEDAELMRALAAVEATASSLAN
jgi:hypothetical protein